jgi:nucleoside-diphosphate-sugar epimerase
LATVLVVGGAGYCGSVLAQELLERGYAVRILDRLYFGDHGLTPIRDRVEFVAGDMRRLPDGVLDGIDAVINAGGLSNDPTAEFNPRANYEMNTAAAVALAEQCRERGVRRYVFASSCSVYDRGIIDETRDFVQDEQSDVDPPGAYAGSKIQAEQQLLPMASDKLSVTVLRKGTLFGFSPRMRYDLVVNTFVKDALQKGVITLHNGGEMWRPLVSVQDAARAYAVLLQAPVAKINGEIFNLVHRNYRISELALRVQSVLSDMDIPVRIEVEYTNRGVRNYRVSGVKLAETLKFEPDVTLEQAVSEMVESIQKFKYTDFEHPRYYNVQMMRLLEQAQHVIAITGSVWEAPGKAKSTPPLKVAGSE